MTDQITIEITTGHCLGGVGNDVYPGQVLVAPRDLPIAEARRKVRMGYARLVPNAPEADAEPAETGPSFITHGDPSVESRDPQPTAPDTARSGRTRTGRRNSE